MRLNYFSSFPLYEKFSEFRGLVSNYDLYIFIVPGVLVLSVGAVENVSFEKIR